MVIDQDNRNRGTMLTEHARELATDVGMDLVEINPNGKPPLCKIVDYGRFRYEQSKKEHKQRKHQHQIKVKEIRLRPKTEIHDLETKIAHTRKFLEAGQKVMVYAQFKGREVVHQEIGLNQITKVLAAIEDLGELEGEITRLGKRVIAIVTPSKKTLAALKQRRLQREREKEQRKAAAIAAGLSEEAAEAKVEEEFMEDEELPPDDSEPDEDGEDGEDGDEEDDAEDDEEDDAEDADGDAEADGENEAVKEEEGKD